MQSRQMFKKMLMYWESCESGSMIKTLDIPDVLAVSAADSDEPSYACYCEDEGVCLGDCFSVNWMEGKMLDFHHGFNCYTKVFYTINFYIR